MCARTKCSSLGFSSSSSSSSSSSAAGALSVAILAASCTWHEQLPMILSLESCGSLGLNTTSRRLQGMLCALDSGSTLGWLSGLVVGGCPHHIYNIDCTDCTDCTAAHDSPRHIETSSHYQVQFFAFITTAFASRHILPRSSVHPTKLPNPVSMALTA